MKDEPGNGEWWYQLARGRLEMTDDQRAFIAEHDDGKRRVVVASTPARGSNHWFRLVCSARLDSSAPGYTTLGSKLLRAAMRRKHNARAVLVVQLALLGLP